MAKFDGEEQVFQRGDLVTYCGDWEKKYAHLTEGSLGVVVGVAGLPIDGRYVVKWITGHPQLLRADEKVGYRNYVLWHYKPPIGVK